MVTLRYGDATDVFEQHSYRMIFKEKNELGCKSQRYKRTMSLAAPDVEADIPSG